MKVVLGHVSSGNLPHNNRVSGDDNLTSDFQKLLNREGKENKQENIGHLETEEISEIAHKSDSFEDEDPEYCQILLRNSADFEIFSSSFVKLEKETLPPKEVILKAEENDLKQEKKIFIVALIVPPQQTLLHLPM